MKRTVIFTGIILFLCLSCQQQPTVDGCYLGNMGKDTVTLHIKTNHDEVSGELDYKFREKDRNSGTVSGQILGDTLLLLDYQFMSEGIQSMRQVAFLIKDGKLIEGHGPMEELEGKLKFTDIQQLTFNNAFELQPIDCQSMP